MSVSLRRDNKGQDVICEFSNSGFKVYLQELAQSIGCDISECVGYGGTSELPGHALSILMEPVDALTPDQCAELWPELQSAIDKVSECFRPNTRSLIAGLQGCARYRQNLLIR